MREIKEAVCSAQRLSQYLWLVGINFWHILRDNWNCLQYFKMHVYLCHALLWNPWRCSVECWLGNTVLVMWVWLWSSRVQFLAGAVNFAPVQNVQTASEAGPLSILFSGCQCSSQGVKHAGFEADHLPPCSRKVGTEWSDTPSLPACLLCVHTDNFYIYLTDCTWGFQIPIFVQGGLRGQVLIFKLCKE